MLSLVKVKKNIKASDYTRISYIERNKCTTFKELTKLDDDSWSYHEVDFGNTIEKSVISNSCAEMLTRTWATFRGTTCYADGKRLDIHTERNRN